ncbi:Uncharacterized protein SCF082_LOCUS1429 [Durusdinium trenchii]|uniref:Uncharacterized protein n=1 Tax=Durusdinium trenchii TaxID=1381693 RepID=A0ABP0HFL7_9DINO
MAIPLHLDNASLTWKCKPASGEDRANFALAEAREHCLDIKDEEEFEDYGDSLPISPSVKSTATTPSRSGRRAERRARRRREAQKAAQQVNSRGSTVTFAELGVECNQTMPGMTPLEGNWPGIMSTAPAEQSKAALFLPPGWDAQTLPAVNKGDTLGRPFHLAKCTWLPGCAWGVDN